MGMQFDLDAIEAFVGDLTVQGLSINTLRAYKADLRDLYEHTGWLPIQSSTDVDNFAVACALYMNEIKADRNIAPATVKRRLAAIRAFGNWRRIDTHGAKGFLSTYKGPTVASGVPHPLKGGVDDIMLMYSEARKPEHQALIVLMGLLGLRVSEARFIRIDDFDEAGGELGLIVRGKGDKSRRVPVLPGVQTLLDRALVTARSRPDGLLVPLGDRTARDAWTRIGLRAGVGFTASHDGRMTFGTTVFQKSKNLRATQDLLGHSSSQTTEGYTGISEATMRKAVDIL